jgi:hypothetical protein
MFDDVHATEALRQCSGTASRLLSFRGLSLLLLFSVLIPPPAFAESSAAVQTPAPEAPVQVDTPPAEQIPSRPEESSGTAAPPQQEQPAPPTPSGREGEQPPEEPTVADTIHAGISKGILATATWLDSFFYDPRYAAEENRTRTIVRLEAFDEEDAHVSFKTRVLLKLVLPQLKNKAHLIIAGDPDEQTEEQTAAGVTTVSRPEQSTDRSLSSSLGYFFKSDERRNISARMGVRYRQGHIVTFVRPHYRVLYKLENWALRFTQEMPYWTDKGWESLTAVDLEREFTNKYFFRTSAVGHWYDDTHGFFYSTIFSLVQPLSPRRALHYDLNADFRTRPIHVLQETKFSVRYRQLIWKDWLYFDIAPQARFPRDRGFDLVPGILFRIEMLFGKYS